MPFLAAPDQIVQAFGMPQGPEWIFILVAMLLIFGRRLPEIMRGLGSSVREFKKGMDHDDVPTATPITPAVAHQPQVPPVEGSVSRDAQPRADDASQPRV